MLSPRRSLSRRIGFGAIVISVLLFASCGDESSADAEPAAVDAGASDAAPKDATLIAIEKRGAPEVEVPDKPATELEVIDLEEGTGDEVGPGATITAHYIGVGQVSGKKFDSSWDQDQPATFSLDGVIPGWTEGLVGMKVGGRRELIIPGAQAYSDQPPEGSGIEPDETLVFVIDLVRIDDPGPAIDAKAQAAAQERGEPKIQVPDPLPTELTVTDDVEGTGDEVKKGDEVTVSYAGASASTGTIFDSSWKRGQPVTFKLDEVIPGWGEGLVGMKVGGRRTLVIPPEQAYGDTPPPGSDMKPGETLVFVVDLVGIG